MSRLFVMDDLRTLAARALAGGDYTPAESARVRAVPDTRTIRYYTTLGLLKPPAQMRGRTAFYSETHVLQIVAIKRLQAQDLSLSDIQQRLVGLTNSRLATIAKLPEGFWSDADKYLEKKKSLPVPKKREPLNPKPTHTTLAPAAIPAIDEARSTGTECPDDGEAFWLMPAALPAALPASIAGADTNCLDTTETTMHKVIELQLAQGIRLSIQFPPGANLESTSRSTIDSAALCAAAQPLFKELLRQNIVRP